MSLFHEQSSGGKRDKAKGASQTRSLTARGCRTWQFSRIGDFSRNIIFFVRDDVYNVGRSLESSRKLHMGMTDIARVSRPGNLARKAILSQENMTETHVQLTGCLSPSQIPSNGPTERAYVLD